LLKAVIDTNLFVSSLISEKGSPAKLIERWKKGEFHLCISQPIIEEVFEVINRPKIKARFGIESEVIQELKSIILERAIISLSTYEVGRSPDPKDNMFIACALEEGADYVISGDSHLLNLKSYQGIQIVDVNTFLGVLNREKTGLSS
jgi:hypothetical protein